MQGLIVLVKNSRFESIKTQTIFGFIFSSKGSSRMGSARTVGSDTPTFFQKVLSGVMAVICFMKRWRWSCE